MRHAWQLTDTTGIFECEFCKQRTSDRNDNMNELCVKRSRDLDVIIMALMETLRVNDPTAYTATILIHDLDGHLRCNSGFINYGDENLKDKLTKFQQRLFNVIVENNIALFGEDDHENPVY